MASVFRNKSSPGPAGDAPFAVLYSPHRPARWSYLLAEPLGRFKSCKNEVDVTRAGKSVRLNVTDPLAGLEAVFKGLKSDQDRQNRFDPSGPPFQGGAVGYLSYEALHYLEDVPLPQDDDVRAPWLDFLFFDAGAAFDHWEKKFHVFGPDGKATRLKRHLEAVFGQLAQPVDSQGKTGRIFSNFSKPAYLQAVKKIQSRIAAGETFQANVSQRFEAETTRTPWDVFVRLNQANPSPYSAFFQSGGPTGLSLVSNSPELLFDLKADRIVTRPIKGTRPRGKNPADDERLQAEMQADAKERAENAMIVDLERNDLGRVCVAGSIRVTEAFAVEKYSHVQHLVSEVDGVLRPDAGAFDALRALFPGGSITGCPKVRTMQLLRKVERQARGPYTGSLGWLGWNGDAAFNILIRTVYFKAETAGLEKPVAVGLEKNAKANARSSSGFPGPERRDVWRAFFHAGGGIVWDSVPETEYRESLQKAEAMKHALD